MFESIPQQEAASNFDQQGANTAKVVDLFYSDIYLLNSEENKELDYFWNNYVQFLGRFRIFENRPLDPVFYFLSKCESKLVKKAKNWKIV